MSLLINSRNLVYYSCCCCCCTFCLYGIRRQLITRKVVIGHVREFIAPQPSRHARAFSNNIRSSNHTLNLLRPFVDIFIITIHKVELLLSSSVSLRGVARQVCRASLVNHKSLLRLAACCRHCLLGWLCPRAAVHDEDSP
jgi:hypothetical protein